MRLKSLVIFIILFCAVMVITGSGCSGQLDQNKPPATGAAPHRPQNSPQELNINKVHDFLEWLKEEDPEKYKDLERLKEYNYDAFEKIVLQGIRFKEWLDRIAVTDPPKYREMKRRIDIESALRSQTAKIRELIKENKQEEALALREEMKKNLDALFDIKHHESKVKIEQIKNNAATLERILEKREENKSEIIANRMDDLIKGKTEVIYDWDFDITDSAGSSILDMEPIESYHIHSAKIQGDAPPPSDPQSDSEIMPPFSIDDPPPRPQDPMPPDSHGRPPQNHNEEGHPRPGSQREDSPPLRQEPLRHER